MRNPALSTPSPISAQADGRRIELGRISAHETATGNLPRLLERPLVFPASLLSASLFPPQYQDFPAFFAANGRVARLTRLDGFYQCPARPRPDP
jgi:hypothetical protein